MERWRFLSGAFLDVWRELNNFMAIGAEVVDNNDIEDENILGFHVLMQQNEDAHRVKGYITTVAEFNEKEFQSHFRLKLESYEQLERLLGPQLRKDIPIKTQLLSVLWLLATPDSYRSVGDRFDISKSTLHNCVTTVISALNNLAKVVIRWPNELEKREAKDMFMTFGGIRGVIGAVDGTFVEISAPKEHPHVYTCRKSFYSIQLQAIALPNLRFTDIFTGYPGSVGDRRVFTNSPIFKNIEARRQEYFHEGEFILGDKAYPVLPWCIPPFIDRGNLGPREVEFNTKHAKTRQVIERSFALLFGRYRRLKYLDKKRTDLIPETILACCVLHNLCLLNEDTESIEEFIEEGLLFLASQRDRMGPQNGGGDGADRRNVGNSTDGHQVRNSVMRSIL